MSHITAELGYVSKNLTVGYGRNAYKAVGEADVLDAVKPAEEKWGVYSYPVSRRTLCVDTLSTSGTKTDNNGNETSVERVQFVFRIETTYRFVNLDNPGDYVDIVSYGDGIDSADKAPGKAMTYSDKYALLKAYKIQTGDDPDKDASPDFYKANAGTPAARPPVQTPPPAPDNVPNQNTLVPPQARAGRKAAPETATPEQIAKLQLLFDPDRLQNMCKILGIESVEQCPADRAAGYIAAAMKAMKANGV